ncbi:translation initiation factor IF-2 [Patescibacteria group bacterium]|nr:translation initiation factor IF-2 [Patescibacteria group bacterium]MBU1868646.1 translation initiation factor IF-2 [Patescibacteria group bacterium]
MSKKSSRKKKTKQSLSSKDRPRTTDLPAQNPSIVVPPPIVCFLGHVDHGKTSLLDYIRQSHIQQKEIGGITQSIGAYHVEGITFIDTPGHEAFTAMRARGGQTANIAILVIAADDGVKPQTIEAINHIKAANVPMIVAINKIDLSTNNVDRVKQQLTEHGVLLEDWGGKIVSVECSAKTGHGIKELLEMIHLVAELEELQADLRAQPKGILIESVMNARRGPMATVIVKQGILRLGQFIIAGQSYGRIKGAWDWQGKPLKEVGPGMPAEVLGLKETVKAGTQFVTVENEQQAKIQLITYTRSIEPSPLLQNVSEDTEDHIKLLRLILKANTDGSLDAIHHALEHLSTTTVHLQFLHEGLGDISEADALLAQSSNAIIIGFDVKIDSISQQLIKQNKLSAKTYSLIYKLLEDLEKIISGKEKEGEIIRAGLAKIRKVFILSDGSTVAGCHVNEGIITVNRQIRVWRGKEQVAEGKVVSLRQEKKTISKVPKGEECGIIISPEIELQEADLIECVEEAKLTAGFSLTVP